MAGSRELPATPFASSSSERPKDEAPARRAASPVKPAPLCFDQLSKSPAEREKRSASLIPCSSRGIPRPSRVAAGPSRPFPLLRGPFATGMKREGSIPLHSPFLACRGRLPVGHSLGGTPLTEQGSGISRSFCDAHDQRRRFPRGECFPKMGNASFSVHRISFPAVNPAKFAEKETSSATRSEEEESILSLAGDA